MRIHKKYEAAILRFKELFSSVKVVHSVDVLLSFTAMKQVLLRSILSLMCFAFLSSRVSAQSVTTAFDWTKTDCDGNTHNLYSLLDEGKVVLMEFVMLPNCQPCITAGKNLKKVQAAFDQTHPGMLKMFSMGFSDNYQCKQMMDWKAANGLTTTAIAQGADQVEQYGGMGMPTIVVVGGKDHKVLYSMKGFSVKDTIAIKAAISQILSPASSVKSKPVADFRCSVYPNPVQDASTINVTLDKSRMMDVTLYNVIGTPVKTFYKGSLASGSYSYSLSNKDLESGKYYVRISNGEVTETFPVTVIH